MYGTAGREEHVGSSFATPDIKRVPMPSSVWHKIDEIRDRCENDLANFFVILLE
jgi:hypothetical protein